MSRFAYFSRPFRKICFLGGPRGEQERGTRGPQGETLGELWGSLWGFLGNYAEFPLVKMAVGPPCRLLGLVTTRAPLWFPLQAPEDIFPNTFRKICFLGGPKWEREQGTRGNPRGKPFGVPWRYLWGFLRNYVEFPWSRWL